MAKARTFHIDEAQTAHAGKEQERTQVPRHTMLITVGKHRQ